MYERKRKNNKKHSQLDIDFVISIYAFFLVKKKWSEYGRDFIKVFNTISDIRALKINILRRNLSSILWECFVKLKEAIEKMEIKILEIVFQENLQQAGTKKWNLVINIIRQLREIHMSIK
jgi:hypothetical protein